MPPVILEENLLKRQIFFYIFGIIYFMIKMRAFWESFFVLIILAILFFWGHHYHLFWKYKWFDIPVHFLGGVWAALTALWISCHFGYTNSIINYKLKTFLIVLFAVLIIGISWEVFEVIGKITFIHDVGYWPDTLSDVLNSFMGGIVAYYYFIKTKKCN